jgi:hypothetical protein
MRSTPFRTVPSYRALLYVGAWRHRQKEERNDGANTISGCPVSPSSGLSRALTVRLGCGHTVTRPVAPLLSLSLHCFPDSFQRSAFFAGCPQLRLSSVILSLFLAQLSCIPSAFFIVLSPTHTKQIYSSRSLLHLTPPPPLFYLTPPPLSFHIAMAMAFSHMQ